MASLARQWPPGLAPFVWEASICDAAILFGDFGKVLADYRWPPGDLFDVPHDVKPGGLVWFTLAAGFYPDGRIAEIFLSSHKPGSPIEAIARDAAVRRAPKALPPAWPGSRVAPGAPRIVVVEDRDHAACVAFLSTFPGVDVDRLFIVVTHVDMGGDPGPADGFAWRAGKAVYSRAAVL